MKQTLRKPDETVGEYLKRKREEQKILVEEISALTMFPCETIMRIEFDQYKINLCNQKLLDIWCEKIGVDTEYLAALNLANEIYNTIRKDGHKNLEAQAQRAFYMLGF